MLECSIPGVCRVAEEGGGGDANHALVRNLIQVGEFISFVLVRSVLRWHHFAR